MFVYVVICDGDLFFIKVGIELGGGKEDGGEFGGDVSFYFIVFFLGIGSGVKVEGCCFVKVLGVGLFWDGEVVGGGVGVDEG